MSEKKKRLPEDIEEEAPKRSEQDWDEVKGEEFTPEDAEGETDPLDRSGRKRTDEHYGEGKDNPYQQSDEALPDEDEESALKRNNARKGGRFDEV